MYYIKTFLLYTITNSISFDLFLLIQLHNSGKTPMDPLRLKNSIYRKIFLPSFLLIS